MQVGRLVFGSSQRTGTGKPKTVRLPQASITHYGAMPQTPWLKELRQQLKGQLEVEMEMTVQVAVCVAARMTTPQIKESVGCSDLDVKMAKQRLEMVAQTWLT